MNLFYKLHLLLNMLIIT